MASTPLDSARASPAQPPSVVAPQHFLPPTPRELRAQAVHRLQVGLFGLAGMLLLVGLANIIMDRARVSDNATSEAATASAAAARIAPGTAPRTPSSDPLADIGVVPEMPSAEQSPAAPTTTTGNPTPPE